MSKNMEMLASSLWCPLSDLPLSPAPVRVATFDLTEHPAPRPAKQPSLHQQGPP